MILNVYLSTEAKLKKIKKRMAGLFDIYIDEHDNH